MSLEEDNEKNAYVQGSIEQVNAAIEIIRSIIYPQTFFMPVPRPKIGLVIGRGGENVKRVSFLQTAMRAESLSLGNQFLDRSREWRPNPQHSRKAGRCDDRV